ncbi:MAG: hypothetical protein ACKE9I_00945 [Methylophagaceae bacterium]
MNSVYAFIDINHSIVAWAAYRGIFVSANSNSKPPDCPISIMFAGMIVNQNNVRLHNEFIIESYRQNYHSNCVSRLYGMYFFEDIESAEKAIDWGAHFKRENLVEMALYPTETITRCDSNWISYAPVNDKGMMVNTEWVNSYWSGKVYPYKSPVWELIVQGRAVIIGTDLRRRAYKVISDNNQKDLCLLEVARIAGEVGSDLGNCFAWITKEENHTYKLTFYINMKDAHDPIFLEKIKNYKGPRNYKDLAIGGEKFSVPTSSGYSCTFRINNKYDNNFLTSVHLN